MATNAQTPFLEVKSKDDDEDSDETDTKQEEETKYNERDKMIELKKEKKQKDIRFRRKEKKEWTPPKFSEANGNGEIVKFILIRMEIGDKHYNNGKWPQLYIDGYSLPIINVKSKNNHRVFIHRFLIRNDKDSPKHIHLYIFETFEFSKQYQDIWKSDDKNNEFELINEENEISLVIYKEEIKVYGTQNSHYLNFQLPNQVQCDIYSGLLDRNEWIEAYNKGIDGEAAINIFLCNTRKMQIYYDKIENIVYSVDNKTVRESKIFGGDDYVYDMNKKKRILYRYLQRKSGDREHKLMPFYEIDNITEGIWISARYQWIQTKCLYGQDNEFNIFRSLCFVRSDEPIMIRLSIGIIVLILQLFLTAGIVMEVIITWDSDEMFNNDGLIMIISFLVFTIISFMYTFTVTKYFEFYDNIRYISQVPWFIVLLDFISNVFIGLIICFISIFFLLQSETITDVVLNSFALTFIIELDDMANLYESDEDKLIEADWSNLRGGNYDDSIRKIRIAQNGMPPILTISSTIAVMFIAPMSVFYAFILTCLKLISYCIKRERKLHTTIADD